MKANVDKIVEQLISKMRATQLISNVQFDICNRCDFDDMSKEQLVDLIEKLFEEHTRLTDVINKSYSLLDVIKNFDL